MKWQKVAISSNYGALVWLFYISLGLFLAHRSPSVSTAFLLGGPVIAVTAAALKYHSMKKYDGVL